MFPKVIYSQRSYLTRGSESYLSVFFDSVSKSGEKIKCIKNSYLCFETFYGDGHWPEFSRKKHLSQNFLLPPNKLDPLDEKDFVHDIIERGEARPAGL